ncbi:hypothetical protein NUW58_g3331 [Xylaria curta]|uniref:Uncharacterized protein n=1 Tax=Xylaria curta TaxID=42375 RepID=A0ACC1PBG1_9PEZI|nr:hypothetical protein NUW58_g3331 [Xylaria curta]
MPKVASTYETGDGRRWSQWSIDSLFDREPTFRHGSPGPEGDRHAAHDVTAPKSAHYQQTLYDVIIDESQQTSDRSPSIVGRIDLPTGPGNNIPAARLGIVRRVRRAWNYGWAAEIVCCIMAIASLIAIVITLQLREGKPPPLWPFGITINALVAVFVVLMKAGLAVPLSEGLNPNIARYIVSALTVDIGISQLKWQWFEKQPRRLTDMDDFDTASRGVWGSFLFLFTTHAPESVASPRPWRYPRASKRALCGWEIANSPGYLAKFAAFVTVLMVAVEPFSQQVIIYVNCPQVSPDFQSSVARTNNYNATGGHTGAGTSDIDTRMAVAINTGIVNPPQHIPSLLSTECKSGNCTFPRFSSVGLCHSCEDLTSQIRNITDESDGVWNFTLPGNEDFPSLYLYHQYNLKTSAVNPAGLGVLDLRVMTRNDYVYPLVGLSAFHCTIVACVRTYSAAMADSILNEQLLSSAAIGLNLNFEDDQARGLRPPFLRLVTSHTLRNGQEEMCESSDQEGPSLVKVAKANVNAAPEAFPNDEVETAWYPEDCVWSFGIGSRYAILMELSSQLNGLDIQRTGGVAVGPIAAKNLWLNGTTSIESINSYLQELTEVMTATIRNTGARGTDKYVRGQVIVNDSCVLVQWVWLSYPIALVGLAIIFLVLIIAQSPQEPSSRTWKSSPLALLFLSMDESRYDVNYYGMTKNDMNHFAETVSVQLKRSQEGKATFS